MWQIHLTMAGMNVGWPELILLGAFIGFLTGMFGVGGGFLLTPLLKILFGIPYPIAVGSGLLQIFITGTYSAWKHWKYKNVDVIMGMIMAGGALGGTEIGVRLLKALSSEGKVIINFHPLPILDLVLNAIFLCLMVGVAILIWKETSSSSAEEEVASTLSKRLQNYRIPPQLEFPHSGISSMSIWVPLGISFFVGILTGLLGVGGGFINFPLMVYILGVPTTVAVGTSAFQLLFSTGYGAVRHALQGHVELLLVVFLLIGSLAGVQMGVRASRFLGGRKIRKYFAWIIIVAIGVIIWDIIQEIWF